MRDSLRSNVRDSTAQYHSVAKAEWIFAWPQQIVLAIDQIDWTERLEKAIRSGGEGSLAAAFRAVTEHQQVRNKSRKRPATEPKPSATSQNFRID